MSRIDYQPFLQEKPKLTVFAAEKKSFKNFFPTRFNPFLVFDFSQVVQDFSNEAFTAIGFTLARLRGNSRASAPSTRPIGTSAGLADFANASNLR